MVAVVVCLSLVIVIIGWFQIGLLRGYEELRRDLQLMREEPARKVAPDREGQTSAPAITGADLGRHPAAVSFGGGRPDTLIAFLSSGCLVCHDFWRDLREGSVPAMPEVGRILVVTKGFHEESPGKLAKLAPEGSEPVVIASSEAWEDYQVPGAPYFVFVEGGGGTILGEGSATQWDQIASLISDAGADETAFRELASRIEREDAALAAAGIGPGHPSLYDPAYLQPPGDAESSG
jgi:hypothetical protein